MVHSLTMALVRCWDFLVGNDWQMTAVVVGHLAAGALLIATGALPPAAMGVLVPVGIAAGFASSLTRRALRR